MRMRGALSERRMSRRSELKGEECGDKSRGIRHGIREWMRRMIIIIMYQ
jgi:hypothetical protein